MNNDNAEYLKKQVYYLGFGDKLNGDLEKNMKEGKDKFELPFMAEFSKGDKKQVVDFNINFSKSTQSDMYFLNNYNATLKGENPEKDKSQTFYINKSNNVTAKEAYNLLDGRAVHKKMENREGQPYEAWLQLDSKKQDNGNHIVKQYHTAYGFNLEKNVAKIPMKELDSVEQTDRLLKSLEKGNLHPVTLMQDGKEAKAFLQANPKDRNLMVFDASMTRQSIGVDEQKNDLQSAQKEGRRENRTESMNNDQKAETEGERKTKRPRMSM